MRQVNKDLIISGTGSITDEAGNIFINSGMVGSGLTFSGNTLSSTGGGGSALNTNEIGFGTGTGITSSVNLQFDSTNENLISGDGLLLNSTNLCGSIIKSDS